MKGTNGFKLEFENLKTAFGPVSAATLVTGSRVSMEDAESLAIIVQVDATTGADLKLELKQHNASTAGTTKDLAIKNPYFIKAGAATKFTKTEIAEDTPLSTIELTALDGVAGLAVIEVLGADLDKNGGFKYVSANVPVAGVAKIVNGVYELYNTRQAPCYELDI